MRRTKEDTEKTRHSILDAAVRVFYQNGVSKATLEDIAQKANVTRGAIYWHFKNKIEIFAALHGRLHQPMADMIFQDLKHDDDQPLRQLQELCTQMLLDIDKDESKKLTLSLFWTKCDYSGDLATLQEDYNCLKQEKISLLTEYFERAKKKGCIAQNTDSNLLIISLLCYMKGIIMEYLNSPDTIRLSENADKIIATFFNGAVNQSR